MLRCISGPRHSVVRKGGVPHPYDFATQLDMSRLSPRPPSDCSQSPGRSQVIFFENALDSPLHVWHYNVMLTRKHFTALADTIAHLKAYHGDNIPVDSLTAAMVLFCEEQNPRFAPHTFRDRIDARATELSKRHGDRWR